MRSIALIYIEFEENCRISYNVIYKRKEIEKKKTKKFIAEVYKRMPLLQNSENPKFPNREIFL